jgi:branched-subunit amino acid aminotransferase/4-amino-4-deoxychorismate lyase
MVVTRGANIPGVAADPQVIVFGHPGDWPTGPARLLPVTAPWHAAGVAWELAGAKLISYAPNMSATRRAKKDGYDDALLVDVNGLILEGPTFSVGWVVAGTIETPGLDLGILDSITRRVIFEIADRLGLTIIETRRPLTRLDMADEVFAFSTIREVQPVAAVGERTFTTGPVTSRLNEAFTALIGELDRSSATLNRS